MANPKLEDQIIAAIQYGAGGPTGEGYAYRKIFGEIELERTRDEYLLRLRDKAEDVLLRGTPGILRAPLFDVFQHDEWCVAIYRYGTRDSLDRNVIDGNILLFKKPLLTYPGATYFSLVPILSELGAMQKPAEVVKAFKKRVAEDTATAGQWISYYPNLLKNTLSALNSGYDLESTIAVDDCAKFQAVAHHILLLALDKGLSLTYSERALDTGVGIKISHNKKIPISPKSLQFDFDFADDSANINYPGISNRYYNSLVDFLGNEKIFRNKVAAADFMRNLYKAGVSKRKLAGFIEALKDAPVWFSYALEPDADLSALVEQLEDDEKKEISPLLEVANRADEVLGEEGTLYRSALYNLIRENIANGENYGKIHGMLKDLGNKYNALFEENEKLKEEINSLKDKQNPQAKPKRPSAIAQKMRQVEKEERNQQVREM